MKNNAKLRWILLIVALTLALPLAGLSSPYGGSAAAAGSAVPLPTVTGPIPVTETSRPFIDRMGPPRAAALKAGYVEEEYFVSGMANVYEWDAGNNPYIRTPNAPFTTRILVRRPARLNKFSGTVWVEPLNPTLGVDLDRMWQLHYDQMIRDGDAWVGITSKPVTIVALQNFDPVRYAPLSMANPLPPDQQTCGRLPGETGYSLNTSKLFENGLIWDIISQVGALLKHNGAQNPLRVAATHVYGEGWSQTGGYALRYFSTFGSLAKLNDGSHVYDGWLTGGATGPTAINQCSSVPSATDPRNQIRPSGVPVISIRTQSDFFSFAYRRADGDTPDDQYRLYELGGPSHDTTTIFENFAPDADIVKSGVTPPNSAVCGYQYVTDFPYEYFFNAAAVNLKHWVVDGIAPPHAERFQYDANNQIVLDQYGNAVGGLRSPYLDVPIATYSMGPTSGVFTCIVLGYKTPFDEDLLQQLYPNHSVYAKLVAKYAQKLFKDGFLLKHDFTKIKVEAAQADVP